jgi:general secretion pathway protein I
MTRNFFNKGFTLLEVLVALSIVATVIGASLRAVGSLLSKIRLAREWPPLGGRQFACNQADIELICKEDIVDTPNPAFRKVEVSVYAAQDGGRSIMMLSQIVPYEK